jgi:hypothetical protein
MDDTKQTTKKPRRKPAVNVAGELAKGAKELQAVVQKQAKGKVGQPTKFTPEMWEMILEEVATYGDLIEICSKPNMPAVSTVRRWYRDNPELKEDIREAWIEASFLGHSVNVNILRGGILSTGDFRRDEALVGENRWHMAKTNRRDFGDKVQVDHVQHQPVIIDWNTIEGEGGDGV